MESPGPPYTPDGPSGPDGRLARLGKELLGWFRAAGLDHAGAEDCVQDTWLRLLRPGARCQPRAPFGAYLRRVARHVLIDSRRRQAVRQRHAAEEHGRTSPLDTGDGKLRDDVLDLHEAVQELPEHLRAVVLLSTRQGLGYAEIAARLGIPVGTVKSRMYYAVRRLRGRLARG